MKNKHKKKNKKTKMKNKQKTRAIGPAHMHPAVRGALQAPQYAEHRVRQQSVVYQETRVAPRRVRLQKITEREGHSTLQRSPHGAIEQRACGRLEAPASEVS